MSFIGTMRLNRPTRDWHARCSVASRILRLTPGGQAKKEGRNALLFCLPPHPRARRARRTFLRAERAQQAAALYRIQPFSPVKVARPARDEDRAGRGVTAAREEAC